MQNHRAQITTSVIRAGITLCLLALIAATTIGYSQPGVISHDGLAVVQNGNNVLACLSLISMALLVFSAFSLIYFMRGKEQATLRLHVKLAVTKLLVEGTEFSPETGRLLLRAIAEPLNFKIGIIWQVDKTAKLLKPFCSWSSCEFKFDNYVLSRKDTALAVSVWKTATIQATSDLKFDNTDHAGKARKAGMHSSIAFPISFGKHVIGVIELFSEKQVCCEKELFALLGGIGSNAAQFVRRIALQRKEKKAEQELHESERLFRHLASNVAEVFLATRSNCKGSLYVSPIFEAVYGCSLKLQMEDKYAFLKVVHKDDRRKVVGFLNNVSAPAMAAGIEFRVVHPDHSVHWIFGKLFPVFDADGQMKELYGISNDITARKEAERTMKDFYSTLSHELRSPLTSIHASLRLMEGGLTGPLSDKTARVVDIARRESDRLLRLINEILDVHKLEAGMLVFDPKPTEIASLVEQSLQAVKGMADESDIKMVAKIDYREPLLCDQDRIIQVLVNILSNAIKFSPHAGIVQLTVSEVVDQVRFSILDQGPGVPKDKQHLLFRKFQQVTGIDGSTKTGTGLGLVISKEIVQRHGGKIGVQSDPGKGALFYFDLPAKGQLWGDEQGPESTHRAGQSSPKSTHTGDWSAKTHRAEDSSPKSTLRSNIEPILNLN